MNNTDKPLIVQSDNSLLLDVHSPYFEEARSEISVFAELEKSPEHMHTYKISPLSLWNAASVGIGADDIRAVLGKFSRFELPQNVLYNISAVISRFGKLRMINASGENRLLIEIEDADIRAELAASKKLQKYLTHEAAGFSLAMLDRGTVKQELMKIGYPVKDEAFLVQGEALPVSFKDTTLEGYPFGVRGYQNEAADTFYGAGKPGNGFGVIVLPCGSGKTVVGMAAMVRLQTNTLILTTNVAAVHQWRDELLDKTTLASEDIGEYTGDRKDIQAVTVATYQILTWRPSKEDDFPHFKLFSARDWGLIIYDEVHLLPAPVFRVTSELQSVRRLGLTATLVREDGREEDVFTLVGPKRYDVPWKELESKGWIAEAYCREIRIDLPEEFKTEYAVADRKQKYRIASENPDKIKLVKELIENHVEDSVLVIGQYLNQLDLIADSIQAPVITGKTPNAERERLYNEFRSGRIRVIVVSKVANFAIDLPDASVAIQVSGSYGSRQEEAQRLGRILRPKKKNSYFYTIVTRYTSEEEYAMNRQKFLTEQGYKYHIEFWGKM